MKKKIILIILLLFVVTLTVNTRNLKVTQNEYEFVPSEINEIYLNADNINLIITVGNVSQITINTEVINFLPNREPVILQKEDTIIIGEYNPQKVFLNQINVVVTLPQNFLIENINLTGQYNVVDITNIKFTNIKSEMARSTVNVISSSGQKIENLNDYSNFYILSSGIDTLNNSGEKSAIKINDTIASNIVIQTNNSLVDIRETAFLNLTIDDHFGFVNLLLSTEYNYEINNENTNEIINNNKNSEIKKINIMSQVNKLKIDYYDK